MKRVLLFILVTLVLLAGCGCDIECRMVRGSGEVVKKDIPVKGITGVRLTTFADLTIESGDEERLVLEAQENLHQYFRAEVRQGVLMLGKKPGIRLRTRKPVRFYLTVRGLDSIALTSSGSISAPGFKAERFRVSVTSSGSVKMKDLDARVIRIGLSSSGSVGIEKISAENLDVKITSSGGLKIDGGKVDRQTVKITSSGSYRAPELESDEARVRLTSSGSAYIRVKESLDVSLTSSGSVYYSGDPEIDTHRTSSGRVRRL